VVQQQNFYNQLAGATDAMSVTDSQIDQPSDRSGWRAADERQCAEEVLTALTKRLRDLFEDEQPCFTDGEVKQVDCCGVLMCKGLLRIGFQLDLDGDLQDALRGLARQLRAVADACD
jgi:hypothetical protein